MRDYSPKRRTALVFTGSGSTGAYHAGVLRALDESGVKIDLVVGSGIGAVSAAYAAIGGGPRLYGEGGFWEGVRWGSFYRLRPTRPARARLARRVVRDLRAPRPPGPAAGNPLPAPPDRGPRVARRRLAGPLAPVGGARGSLRSLPGGPGGARLRARHARDRGGGRRVLQGPPALRRGLRVVPRRRPRPRPAPARPLGDRPGRLALGRPPERRRAGTPLRGAPRREPRRAGLPRAGPAHRGPRSRGGARFLPAAGPGGRLGARGRRAARRRGGPARRPATTRSSSTRWRRGSCARWRCRCAASRSRREPCTRARRTA